ncbi:MAG: hypothetical protein A2Y94_01720 [Caldithrix sp. RBG_13_44_9]|nr:MAG: hypothetical protein A2Y94_01720 [Caldithrix sp. RBG_13_44_9]
MDIKEKLARLEKGNLTQTIPEAEIAGGEDWIQDFERELGAVIIKEKNSFIILKESIHPLHHFPYFPEFKIVNGVIPNFYQINGSDPALALDFQKTLFIDLETTGISGGSGTFAFLVGLGHIELDHIVVRQYLLPDFQFEWLLLKTVENSFLSFENLATFNGKSFDIPLLRNRFVLNRMDSVLDELNHIDLLHSARRIWKRRLSVCDLENLEYTILGQERIQDIPSEMIPQIYFEYLRKRQVSLLRQVLEHNFYDIANMVLLAMQIALVTSDPFKFLTDEDDLFSLAKYYYQRNYIEAARPLFHHVLDSAKNSQLKVEALFFLSMLYKRAGEYQQSSELFQQLLKIRGDHADAIEELAKYFEHKEKNYQAALELINGALEHIAVLEQLGKDSYLYQYKESFYYRRNRLERRKFRQDSSTGKTDTE